MGVISYFMFFFLFVCFLGGGIKVGMNGIHAIVISPLHHMS